MVAGVAALAYLWGIGNAAVETFYGAAARSMALNWHNFFFGSFDPGAPPGRLHYYADPRIELQP
jgi:hypothetical protein